VRFGNDAQFRAGLFLAPDIDLGGRVLADAHERESGRNAAPLEFGDPRGELGLDLRGNRASVNDF